MPEAASMTEYKDREHVISLYKSARIELWSCDKQLSAGACESFRLYGARTRRNYSRAVRR
jgi:hypothetical protein